MNKRTFHGNQYKKIKPKRSPLKRFLMLLWIPLLAFILISYVSKTTVINTIQAQDKPDTLALKIEQLKREIVDTISKCEAMGYNEDDALITFDPNPNRKRVSIPSIGLLQFKQETVQYYYKTLYNKEITKKEATLIALDDKKAEDLAYDILFKTDAKGWSNWYNCAKKHKVEQSIEFISKLKN